MMAPRIENHGLAAVKPLAQAPIARPSLYVALNFAATAITDVTVVVDISSDD